MNKKIILLILLLSILMLSACSKIDFNNLKQKQYRDPATINYFKGTKGLTLNFQNEAPPETVFEGSEFDVQAIIHNEGAYDVINKEKAQVEIVTDSANTIQLKNQGVENSYLKNLKSVQLHGKSYFYPEGEQDFFALNRYRARKIMNGFEKNTIRFYVTMCYPYRTYLSDEVCIDTNTNRMDVRKQVCSSKDKTYAGGQGAPVAVTAVETNMVPKGAFIEPQFIIHIKHEGDGIVSLYDDKNKDANTCDNIGPEQVNKMELSATLGNDNLECFPNPVFLRDGKAKIECRLKGSQVLATAANYYTNLNVELRYLYTQTFDKKINVRRTDSTTFSTEGDFKYGKCAPWDIWDDKTETCISKCEYCANLPNSGDNPNCVVTDTKSFSSGTKEIGKNYACVYTRAECINEKDHCIQQDSDFCVPGMYCGEPECSYNSKKNNKPKVYLEEGVPEGKIIWYCQDKDNTVDLNSACGCLTESYYAILLNDEKNCDDLYDSDYKKVSDGKFNPSTMKTYYTIDMPSTKPKAICLKVKDAQDATTVKKASFSCLDQKICFK